MGDLLLAIDQGTSSTRAVAYDADLRPLAWATRRLGVVHPRPGWVEQDPREILASVVATVAEVLAAVGGPGRIAAVGLDNQGETVVAWDARTGEPLAPAVVWQCKRSAPIIERLRAAGHDPWVRERTGLPLDPYFSAGKMAWLLEEVPEVAAAARAGRLRLGTVDAFLTARLGGEARTDTSTASRTQLLELRERRWDPELAGLFSVPPETLPAVGETAGNLGELRHAAWGGALPLRAMVCDQQAALAGHGCFAPGTLKATYGTGVFVLANAGPVTPPAPEGLLATIAWTIGGRTDHAFDGGVFAAGTLLDWLRDGLGLYADPADTEALAGAVDGTVGVRVLPALVGLGAPWWRPEARGVIAGLTPGANRAHVARAALDGIAHRVADVVEAMAAALPAPPAALRVDGGLTANRYLVQRQADLLGIPLELATTEESTALGAAALAALGAGLFTSPQEIVARVRPARSVAPRLPAEERERERAAWRAFVAAAAAIPPAP